MLGAGNRPMRLATNVDMRPGPGINTVYDLRNTPWPLDTGRYQRVIAEHILEHMPDPTPFLDEVYRITKPHARVEIEVPHWKHHLAHARIDHRTTWAHNSFDGCYNTAGKFTKDRVAFRLSGGKWLDRPQWLGRQLCKKTGLVSGLRFYLRRLGSKRCAQEVLI